MKNSVEYLLSKKELDRDDITELLKTSDDDAVLLYRKAAEVRDRYVGNTVYLRGLIEYSNTCGKNCLYCGIRRENRETDRYTLSDAEVIEAAMMAYRLRFGSIAIQSGEITSPGFAENIERLVRTIRQMTHDKLGITLSLGEQSAETYRRWFEAGAHRYLLRIEASSPDLYRKVHPEDAMHDYHHRLDCLRTIKETGYQTGTGVMIGLPYQTISHLVDDIIFMRDFDIDMCGMGPFIEHSATPLGKNGVNNLFLHERFDLTLRMIAVARIVMKDINIVASTAMQATDPAGREKAISCGANIIMPNITPERYRKSYRIYERKPAYREINPDNISGLNLDLIPGTVVGLDNWGDTPHFSRRQKQG